MLNKLAKHHNYWLKILTNLNCDRDLANDIVQEMYLKLHDAKHIAYGDDVNKYYVYKTLKSLYIQHLKDLSKNRTIEFQNYHDVEQVEYLIEKDESEDILLEKVRRIVNGLSLYQQQLFQLYFGVMLNENNINIKEGLSMDKLANIVDSSKTHIFYNIKQIKRQFRDELKEDLQDFFNEDYDKI